jgi:hypothetical protein
VSLLSEHNDTHWRCEDLENDLKKAGAESATCIAALESNVKSVETHCEDLSAASDKQLSDLEAELTRDLIGFQKLYIHNVHGMGGLCLPMPEGDPSAANYIGFLSKLLTS